MAKSNLFARRVVARTSVEGLVMEFFGGDDFLVIIEAMQRLFGLTRSESEISPHLLDGKTLRDIAGLRGVSIHTVRNQVKSAMTKAGAKRQTDYVLQLYREFRN